MTGRRELIVGLAVVLAGSALVLLAGTQPWASVPGANATVPSSVEAALKGSAISPGARALGLVGLAGIVALLATRRAGRRVVGVLLALAGLAVCGLSVFWSAEPPALLGATNAAMDRTFWSWISVAGGVLLLAGGLLAAIRSPHWPAMGSRYDAPARKQAKEDDPWAALDRGEDPTV
ncbi:Trp biosynthesis-associated membrane protein [Flindersiella endophytica]